MIRRKSIIARRMYESKESDDMKNLKIEATNVFENLRYLDACQHSLDDTSAVSYCHMLQDAERVLRSLCDLITDAYRAAKDIAYGMGVSAGSLGRIRPSDNFKDTLSDVKALYKETYEVARLQGF